MAALSTGSKAPEFNLKLLGGGSFSLYESLAAGAVALAFFKVSCPVCQYAFPYFERLSQKLNGRAVRVIGVSEDDAAATAAFATEFGVTFPIAIDPAPYRVSAEYGLTNVPTFFLIGEDARVEHVIVGWSKQELENVYDPYLNSQSPLLFSPEETVADFKVG